MIHNVLMLTQGETTRAQQSAVAEIGDDLATTDMGQKVGERAAVGGSSIPHLTQCVLGRGLTPYQVAS